MVVAVIMVGDMAVVVLSLVVTLLMVLIGSGGSGGNDVGCDGGSQCYWLRW